jgi:nicotinate (nicotinamide) nucleotide adenylyltransferase
MINTVKSFNNSCFKSETAKVCVLGGSFDPPHYGHALMAASVLHFNLAETVTLVPSPPRWDKKQKSSPESRILWTNTLKTWLEGFGFQVAIDLFEIQKPRFLGSYETLNEILTKQKQKFPNISVALALGADSYSFLPKWHNETTLELTGPKVIKEFQCLVFDRAIPIPTPSSLSRELKHKALELYASGHPNSCILPHLDSPTYHSLREKLGIDKSCKLSEVSSTKIRLALAKYAENSATQSDLSLLGKYLPPQILALFKK